MDGNTDSSGVPVKVEPGSETGFSLAVAPAPLPLPVLAVFGGTLWGIWSESRQEWWVDGAGRVYGTEYVELARLQEQEARRAWDIHHLPDNDWRMHPIKRGPDCYGFGAQTYIQGQGPDVPPDRLDAFLDEIALMTRLGGS